MSFQEFNFRPFKPFRIFSCLTTLMRFSQTRSFNFKEEILTKMILQELVDKVKWELWDLAP